MDKRPWTPGPWDAPQPGGLIGRMVDGRRQWTLVASIGEQTWDMRSGEAAANHYLIAAAPELYEALDDLVNYLSNTAHHNALPVAFARGVLRTAGGDS